MPRYEVIAHIYVEAVDSIEARDVIVDALGYMQDMQDTSNNYGVIVDFDVGLEPDCLEP